METLQILVTEVIWEVDFNKLQLTMKKIFFNIFALALATMVGCQKSDITDNNGSNNETQLITVTATIDDATKTRVALTPDTDGEGKPIVKVAWKDSGEAFKVHGVQDDPPKIRDSKEFSQVGSTNKFSGEVPDTYGIYYATYPASNGVGLTVKEGDFYLNYDKSNFTSQNGKLSEERTLMYTTVNSIDNDTQFDFEHFTTLLMPRFRVVGESVNLGVDKIASITFKDMLVPDGTADFNIDCTSHTAEDDIYVYLPFVADGCYGDNASYSTKKTTIEVVVNTTDAKIYEGSITIPAGTTLALGKLYTAAFWITRKEFTNVITYTTTDNTQLSLDDTWYEEHTFEDGVGKIYLSEVTTTLPGNAFISKNTLATVTLSSHITTIGASAFKNCGALTTVIMPSVTEIQKEAFNMEGTTVGNIQQGLSNKLANIDLSNITTFGEKALYQAALTNMDLSGATSIGQKAFGEMVNLTTVTMPAQNCTTAERSFAGCSGLYTIDLTNISTIEKYAFENCTKLKTVIINRATAPSVGENPFKNCTGLTILVPEEYLAAYESTSLSSYIAANAIIYTTTNSVQLTLSNAWGEGDECVYTAHTFENGVGKISLKSGVTTLPANAFNKQETLKTFTLPMCITTIGDRAFYQCCYLSSITMPNVTSIGESAFDMDGLHWEGGYNLAESLKVTNLDLSKITVFGNRAFFKVASLESIDISGATQIGNYAFYELGRLTSVIMPKQDCVLGASAFSNDHNIRTLDLSHISSIGNAALSPIYNIQTIIINRETPPTIGENILHNSNDNVKIYVPDAKVDEYKSIGNLVQYAEKIKPISEM